MEIVFTILWFLLALGILVTFHEFGHFYAARRCGVKVIRFSVGFGRPLFTFKDRLGTEYVLAAIPLGGYVKMLDEREGDVAPEQMQQAFTQKLLWQRMLIVAAGPLANFILAIGLYFVLALMGSTGVAPIVGKLPQEGIAAVAGLQEGDEIVSVDQQTVSTWGHVASSLLKRIGDTGNIALDVKRAHTSVLESLNLPIERWLHDNDRPDFFAQLGIARYEPIGEPVIYKVLSDSPAERAGLQEGDRVISADHQPIATWQQWVAYVRARPNEAIKLVLEREGQSLQVSLTPKSIEDKGQQVGQAGVSTRIVWPEYMLRSVDYTVIEALERSVVNTWERATFILAFIKKLIFAEVSTKNLGGTFTIAQVAGDSAKAGIISYIAFLAFLSVSLGVFNLLPIPVLDGGHLLYYTIEAIKGSPVSDNIQVIGYQLGLFLVLGVMVLAHVNDLVRIFS